MWSNRVIRVCYINVCYVNYIIFSTFLDGRLESCCGRFLPLEAHLILVCPQSSCLTTWVMENGWTTQRSVLWRCTLSWGTAGFTSRSRDPTLRPWTNGWARSWSVTWQRYRAPLLLFLYLALYDQPKMFRPWHLLMKNVQYMLIYTFFFIIFSLKLSIVVGVVLLQFTSTLILFLRLLAFFFFNPTDRPM